MSTPASPQELENYTFLSSMLEDDYYPRPLVEKGVQILQDLCEQLNAQKPSDLDALYVLTHAATEKFNELQEEFNDADSEIDTVAREFIVEDFVAIAKAYAFTDADMEELVAPRDW